MYLLADSLSFLLFTFSFRLSASATKDEMAPKFQKGPDLKRFMDKRLMLSLNGNRSVVGTLRGYDAFLNVVLENAQDEAGTYLGQQVVIRGNSIVQLEGVERIKEAPTAPGVPETN